MRKEQLVEIDKEETKRTDKIVQQAFSGKKGALSNLLRHKKAKEIFNNKRIIIPSFDEKRLLSAIPFFPGVFVEICPGCLCTKNIDLLKPYLETGFVIPLLLNKYSSYNTKFSTQILGIPHISFFEYSALRNVKLIETAEKRVCKHCVGEFNKKIEERLKSYRKPKIVKFMVEVVFFNLIPFINSDFDLIVEMLDAISQKDLRKLHQIVNLSFSIKNMRSAQGLEATLHMPVEAISKVKSRFGEAADKISLSTSLAETKAALIEGLNLEIPMGIPINKYLEIVCLHKEHLNQISSNLVKAAEVSSGSISLAKLQEEIALINEEIRRIRHSGRYQILKITTGLLGANKSIVASIFLAAALGITGNILGCGASLAVGIGTKVLSKKVKLPDINGFDDIRSKIYTKLNPLVNFLIGKYLNTNPKTIQILQIQTRIKKSKNKK